jgi:hypothetical protein
MDISVSRLNNRLAFQLPSELPLGLVFVVGRVEHLAPVEGAGDKSSNDRPRQTQFDLVEAGYRLRCEVTPRAAADTTFGEGDKIRAGGHLAFDPQQANYYLLARDIEVVDEPVEKSAVSPQTAGRAAFTSILTDIQKRSEAARLSQAEVPPWVQRIAPPEVQAELEVAGPKPGAEPAAGNPAVAGPEDTFTSTPPAGAPANLNEELVTFLSAAMESEEEVNLTAETVAGLSPESSALPPSPILYETPGLASETSPVTQPAEEITYTEEIPRPPLRTQRQETDWLVMLLIFSFLILTAAIIVTSALLLLR